MKNVACDHCGKPIRYPGFFDVSLKARYNVGRPGKIIGFVEVDILGDFCNAICLSNYARGKALRKDSSVNQVSQDVYTSGFTLGDEKLGRE